MKIVGRTDIGRRRTENQDNYRAGRQSDDTIWAVVCDGMGGARGGAVASSIAVSVLEQRFSGGLTPQLPEDGIRALMEDAASQANREVYQLACADPSKRGMGTTLVALVLRGSTVHLMHAGDSRAYLYRSGALERLTRDHSMVQEMVENGSLTPQQAENHPNKNLITRAVGVNAELEVEYGERQVQPGDILLLCSDGLTNSVSEQDLCGILAGGEFFGAADAMVRAALAGGGQDNITSVLVKVEATEE